MMLLLLKVFGVKRIAGWALRLTKAVAMLGLLVAVGLLLAYGGDEARVKLLMYGVMVLVIAGIQALWRRRRKSPMPEGRRGERTIDGKVVPDKLTVSALGVPQRSSDGDYVLRGLPDYAKTLLGLGAGEFAYVPELPERSPLYLPVADPVEASKESTVPPLTWVGAAAAVVLLVVGGLWLRWYSSPEHIREMVQERMAAQAMGSEQTRPGSSAQQESPTPPSLTAPSLEPQPAPVQAATVEVAPAPPATQEARESPEPSIGAKLFSVDNRTIAEDRAGIWRDASTGLLWTSKDNGPQPIMSVDEGVSYCTSLTAGGVKGWRLPGVDEIDGVLEMTVNGWRSPRAELHTTLPAELLLLSGGKGMGVGGWFDSSYKGDRSDKWRAFCVHD